MFLDRLNQTQQRLVISTFSVIFVFFSIYFARHSFFQPIFVFFIGTIISAALYEYFTIAQKKGFDPLVKMTCGLTFLYLFSLYFLVYHDCCQSLPLFVLWMALTVTLLYYFVAGKEPFVNSAITCFGLIYLTVPLSCLLLITYFFPEDATQDGRWWLAYLLIVAKTTDTCAFFVGSNWGEHKMVPFISPKKSWEGAIAGLVGAVAISFVMFAVCHIFWKMPPMKISWFQSLWIAAAISILAQIGDLAESLLKRDAGVKDSSNLPGLGGMLDIVDSLVLSTPFLYFVLKTLY